MASRSLTSRFSSLPGRLPVARAAYREPLPAARTGARRYATPSKAADGATTAGGAPRRASPLRNTLLFGAGGLAFVATGFFTALYTTLPANLLGLGFLTDEAGLASYAPADDEARRIDAYVDAHPLAQHLRADPGLIETRPHVQMPEAFRRQSLTAGTLAGPRGLAVPPRVWRDGAGQSMVSIIYIGPELCGHPGIVHGGLLATLLDEGFAGCCFDALPHRIGVTANLNINYRSPAPAGRFFVLRATTTKVEGRKAWVEGRLETLEDGDKKPTTIVEGNGLFVSPKHAAMMPKLRP